MRPQRSLQAAAKATLAAMVLATACGSAHSSRHSTTPLALPLEALDGGVVDLRAYRGRVVVLHLFTTWSLVAQADLIQLTDASRRYGDRVTIIGIALDPTGYRVVSAWRRATRVPYMVAIPGPGLREGQSMLGRVRAEPTTVVLRRSGSIAERMDGPLAAGQLAKVLARLTGKR